MLYWVAWDIKTKKAVIVDKQPPVFVAQSGPYIGRQSAVFAIETLALADLFPGFQLSRITPGVD